jgi:catechol 2,3-dioxygenase-like lactoylglutathione lyase family enzyme
MAVIGYRHTGIIVDDLEKSLEFYQGFLNFELLQRHRDDSQYISEITGIQGLVADYAKLAIPGGFVLELLTYPSHPEIRAKRKIHQPGEAHLAFEVDSVENMFNRVCEQGIFFLSAPVLSSEKIAKVFFCLDPDGYRVEFVEMLTDSYSWKLSQDE